MPLERRPWSARSLLAWPAVVVLVAVTVPLQAGRGLADVGPDPVEEPGSTIVGELVQAYDDPEPPTAGESHEHAAEESAGLLSWVQTDDGSTVRVPTEVLPDVEAGATLQVTVGGAVHDEAAAQGLEPAREVLAADVLAAPAEPPIAPEGTVIDHRVTVVLALPPGTSPDGTTPARVQALVDGVVAPYWRQQTGGQVGFRVVAARDWTPVTAGCDDPFGMWSQAAAQAGWTAAPGSHLLVYVPDQAATARCSYGLGTVGTAATYGGGMAYVKDVRTSVVAHELGHHLGLGHSSAVQCDGAVDTGSCRTVAYGDYYDVMGVSWEQVGSLNAPQAARLGVLPLAQQPVVTVTDPAATRTLAPVSAVSGIRALRLADPEGNTYWLEYRAATGQDSWLAQPSVNWPGMESGVTLRRAAEHPDTSLLLDGSPSAAAAWTGDRRVALPVGSPVSVSGGDFVVMVSGVTATQATVQVTPSGGARAGVQATGSPLASMDEVTRRGGEVLVHGWAYDPDSPDAAVPVVISVDGATTTASSAADPSESSFAAAAAIQAYTRKVAVPAGVHQICASALNVAGPGQAVFLGCRTVS